MPSLHVIRGRDAGKHFEVPGSDVTIGRDSTNQIHLHDTEVSRQHARLEHMDNGGMRFRDLGSSNGSFINSRKVVEQQMHSGDRIQLGRTLMIYRDAGDKRVAENTDSNVELVASDAPLEHSQIRSEISNRSLAAPVANTPTASDSMASEWDIVYQVGQAISRTVDVDALMRQVLDLIFQWIHCDRGCVLVVDEVSGHLTQTYRRNRIAGFADKKMEISQTILNHVIANKAGVLTSNAQDDTRWQSAKSVVHQGVHEAICVPMLGRYGTVGAIYVDTLRSPAADIVQTSFTGFTQEHLKLLVAIGNQAALAIEDTQFYRAMLQSERLAAMGQTIANLSHHVKNILQGMHGGSYLVQAGLQQDNLATVRKGWRIVERNQERISNLVMDMLSFSKERQPEMSSGDLCETVDEVVELMQARAREIRAEFTWNRPQNFPSVSFDAEAIHRAILNILINALDAVEALPTGQVNVSIGIKFESGQVEIQIEDNGEGMTEEEIQRIFSVFESTKGSRGTGLGLPVSRKILREHGGDIEVTSVKGKGTRFTLRWPGLVVSPESPTLAE